MKGFLPVIIFALLTSFGCAKHSSESDEVVSGNKAGYTTDFTDRTSSVGDSKGSVTSSNSLGVGNSGKVILVDCKEIYNDNLIATHWVTIKNNTSRSIKGIEVRFTYDDEPFMYKISLGPYGSKRLKTGKFDCNSGIVGIIFSNGEYENTRSMNEQMGINESDQMDYQKQ